MADLNYILEEKREEKGWEEKQAILEEGQGDENKLYMFIIESGVHILKKLQSVFSIDYSEHICWFAFSIWYLLSFLKISSLQAFHWSAYAKIITFFQYCQISI